MRALKRSIKISIFIASVSIGALGVAFGIQAYPEFMKVSVHIEKSAGIKPDEEIRINFSQAVFMKSYENKVRLDPPENFSRRWENSGKTLVITPKDFWQIEKGYAIEVGRGRSRFLADIGSQDFKFSTLKSPAVEKISPPDGSKDVVFDIEDPIVVDFKDSFENFWIRFEFDPPVEFAYEINPEKDRIKLMPKSEIQEGMKYQMAVYAKYKKDSDDGYRKISQSSFETLPPAPVAWDKDLGLRIEQAKKYTRAKIASGKYIDINLNAQVMSIFENGKLLDSFMISSGKRGMETPKGEHRIYNKSLRPWSKKYSLYMPFWMAITPSGEYGIHELPEWPGGYKEGANHLGTPVSHGCVRLGIGAARTVFDWAEIGTPVVVY